MEINNDVKPGLRIKAFYLFFIIFNVQTGVAFLAAPRHIYLEAKQDAWVSVLLSGVIMHLVFFVMFMILRKYKSADVFGIQVDVFGTWIGKFLGSLYLVYIFSVLLSVMIDYIQIVQVFIYPQMQPWMLGSLLVLLIIYSVLGGIRVVVGISFVFFFLSFWLLFFLYEPARLLDFQLFRPVLEASPKEIFLGSYQAGFSFIGMEILFIIYPFIENKEKAVLPAQLGIGLTTLLILLVTVISIGYFSSKALETMLWPVLTLYKIVEYPVIERFDLIVITQWLMVVFPNFVLFSWMITYGMRRLYGISQKKILYIVAVLLLVGITFIKQQFVVSMILANISNIGYAVAIIYPLVLLPFVLIKKKLSGRKGASK